MAAAKRLQRELMDLSKSPLENVTIGPPADDLLHWEGVITGPAGSPFENGNFNVTIDFPTDFPFKPPKVLFTTRIYHPNIDDDGAICLGLLKTESWKPATKMADVLIAVIQMLAEPNPDDPLVTSIAEQFKTDHAAYVKTAQEWVAKHASGSH